MKLLFFLFLVQKMENKKSEIKSIIKEFREIIKTYGLKYKKTVLKNLRKPLRSHEKIVYDGNEDEIEYLQERVNYLNKLLKVCTKQNQCHDHNDKYHSIETIKYLFEKNDEDYNLHQINYQQYQSFSSKILSTLDEYFKIKDCKVKRSVNTVFRSTKNPNDKRTLQITSKTTTDVDEIFGQLIKKY